MMKIVVRKPILLLLLLALVILIIDRTSSSKLESNIRFDQTSNAVSDVSVIEVDDLSYKFDVPYNSLVTKESNLYRNRMGYRFEVSPRKLANPDSQLYTTNTGTVEIYSVQDLDWKELYSELGMVLDPIYYESSNTEKIKPELEEIDRYFEMSANCQPYKLYEFSPTCKGVNRYNVPYVRFDLNYISGSYSTGTFYVYKLPNNVSVIALYRWGYKATNSPHTSDEFLELQTIIESIR